MKIGDDTKSRDDALEADLCQSFKTFQVSMGCQMTRINRVEDDTARKYTPLQSELAGVRTELAAGKIVPVPVNTSSASEATKEARKSHILASISRRIKDAEMVQGRISTPYCIGEVADVTCTFREIVPSASRGGAKVGKRSSARSFDIVGQSIDHPGRQYVPL